MSKIIKEIKALDAIYLLVSLAVGLILFLAPNDMKASFSGTMREFMVVVIALATTVVALMIFNDYRIIGLALTVCVVLISLKIIISNINFIIQNIKAGNPFDLQMDMYDVICYAIVCFVPFLVCLLIRIFSIAKWDTKKRRKQFEHFFYFSTLSFLIYYNLLYLILFVFNGPVDLFSERTISLIPFENAGLYWPSYGIGAYCIANIAFYLPAGFLIAVYMPDLTILKKLYISLAIAIATEVLQLIFNTSYVDFEDIILSVIGFMIGVLIKSLLEICRRYILLSGDDDIFAFLKKD